MIHYSVYIDDMLLYDPFVEGYCLTSSNLKMLVNDFGFFQFSVLDNHPLYNNILLKRSEVKIYKNGKLVWLGRVADSHTSLDKEKTITCEFCLAYLNDSLVRPFEFSGSPEELFEFFVSEHNRQVNENRQFIIGDCTVIDPNDYIIRSSTNYGKTFNVMAEKTFRSSLGGYLKVSFNEEEKPILSWLSEIEDFSSQVISYGENLAEYEVDLLYDEFCTAIVPLGSKFENSDERLTIKEVNDGKDYLINSSLAETYGIIFANTDETTWDDVTIASNLKVKGQDWLNSKGVVYKHRVEIGAEDISMLDVDSDAFWFLQKVRVIPYIGSEMVYLISDFDIDLRYPAELSIVLSDETFQYASNDFTASSNRAENNNTTRIKNIESSYLNGQQARSVVNETLENSTIIKQQAENIILQVLENYTKTSDFESLQREVFSNLTQLSNQLEIRFTDATTKTNNLAGATQTKFDKYESFLRVIAQSATTSGGLVIGESTSKIKTKLENDIYYFFEGDEATVSTANAMAYFSAGKLYVNETQIQKLVIGVTGKLLDISIVGEGLNTCAFFSGRLV